MEGFFAYVCGKDSDKGRTVFKWWGSVGTQTSSSWGRPAGNGQYQARQREQGFGRDQWEKANGTDRRYFDEKYDNSMTVWERWIQHNYKVFGYLIKSSRRRDCLRHVDVGLTATSSWYPVRIIALEKGGELLQRCRLEYHEQRGGWGIV